MCLRRATLSVLVFFTATTTVLARPQESVTSPNAKVEVTFNLDESGQPLTIELGGGLTVAIAESNLVNYSGLYLARVEGGNDSRHPVLVTKLAPLPSDPGVCVRAATPLTTPWRVLMIGEYVVVARRRGEEWFIGAMTDAPRSLSVSLAALGEGVFEATIYADTAETTQRPTELGVSKKLLEGSSSLTLDLAQGGGAALHLKPNR